jgi:hypothetical protein
VPSPAASDSTRYEKIMTAYSAERGDLAARFAMASRLARAAVPATSEHDRTIRDVAAGVAAPALAGFVLWLLAESRRRGLGRLRFLSRDGEVLYELALRLASAIRPGLDLEYVYGSRLVWSLAGTRPDRLSEAAWLFDYFVQPNAAELCACLGLSAGEFRPVMLACGVSLAPDARADEPAQGDALRRFVSTPEVAEAVGARIEAIRRVVLDYAAQHHLAEAGTGLVDLGWTGRMTGSLIQVCEAAGMSRPWVLMWGHEPLPAASGWYSEQVAAYMYNTATGQGLRWRLPNEVFVMEAFCMGGHGILSGYRADTTGTIQPVLQSTRNEPGEAWGLALHRSTLYAFSAALDPESGLPRDDIRPLVHQLLDAFWCHPTRAEALAWGACPYETDPAGTAKRPLARPFTAADQATRGDRVWLAGSLAMSDPDARVAYLRQAPEHELAGARRDRPAKVPLGADTPWPAIPARCRP